MGTFTFNGKTYKSIEGKAPKMTKKQGAEYGKQVGGFYKDTPKAKTAAKKKSK